MPYPVMGTINLSVLIKAITITSKKSWAIPIIDKLQFFKAISVIVKLSPINCSNKCCGKFSMPLTKFFASHIAKMCF